MQFFARKAYYYFVTSQGERIMPLLPCYTYLRNIAMRFLMHKVILVARSRMILLLPITSTYYTLLPKKSEENKRPGRKSTISGMMVLKVAKRGFFCQLNVYSIGFRLLLLLAL